VNTTAALLQDLSGDRNVSVQIDHPGLQTLRPLTSFCGEFLTERVHSNYPRSPEDSKQVDGETPKKL